MFGDCEVLSAMGGGSVSDSLFPSQVVQNPNYNFMSTTMITPFNPFPGIVPKEESGVVAIGGKEEAVDSGSGSGHVEGASGGEQENDQPNAKKKRYHRHTARQIQAMEAMFMEYPHPDDKQRMRLSQELGLKPRQVKFWFQNRRTQNKAHQDRSDNAILKAENESLKNDNFRLKTALNNIVCPNCGGPALLGEVSFEEQHLRFENAQLKEEIERFSCITSRYTGGSRHIQSLGHTSQMLLPSLDLDMNMYNRHFQEPVGTPTNMIPIPSIQENAILTAGGGILIMEHEKPLALELAMNVMEELVSMCQVDETLWVSSGNGNTELLNAEEHSRLFLWRSNFKQNSGQFRMEATRESTVVIMNSITLVDAFLDANKWMDLFPSIVSHAKTLQIITSGHPNGSLHLMYAELQALSPLVPTREAHFLRYCQQNLQEGTWVIVDFPIDSFHDSLQPSAPRYRRRPSGCVIQDMPNGYSKVTWVEHAEVEDKPVHEIFNHLVSSGIAFGAKRWLAVLQQQCERLASLMAKTISDHGAIPTIEARRNLMRLSQRMIRTFCYNITTSGGQAWTGLTGSTDDSIRITTRKSAAPGQPNGMILCGVSTTWLPFSHDQVFELLRNERRRSQFDVLFNGTSSHEVAHIANGSHPGNSISLLRIDLLGNTAQNVELMLQESSTDQSGSLVVYTTLDVDSVQLAMSGGDQSYIPLLPLGYVITPAPSVINNNTYGNSSGNSNGSTPSCLLTVGVQVLSSPLPGAKISVSGVSAINNHICNAVHQIKDTLLNGIGCSGTGTGGGGTSSCNDLPEP
ncbi:hypothetical protein GIB67_042499 [Kingdonia uniflora]|uniref:Uncharacterized protein n=1 Tax=Kingdonia uniflora TaxID=39325 RepID=A0A7J7M145_9MAGN|nr:hypothetical protein GIB67_042499 [Kingdonia uniflora]